MILIHLTSFVSSIRSLGIGRITKDMWSARLLLGDWISRSPNQFGDLSGKHPKGSRKWVKNKYFRMTEQGRDWCFFGRKDGKDALLVPCNESADPEAYQDKRRGEFL